MRKELTPELLELPKRIADLPTPPDVLAYAQECKKERGLSKRAFDELVDELKLQYYYGGWHIRCLPTKQGSVVVVIDLGDEEDYKRQVQALSPEVRQRAVVAIPSPWMDDTSWILGFWNYEDPTPPG